MSGDVQKKDGRDMCLQVSQLLRAPKDISASENSFSQALRDFGVVLSDEKQLADIIIGVLPRADDQQKYNLDVIVNLVSQECSYVRTKKISWKAVVQYFDCNHIAVRSMDDFQLLARLFQKVSGTIFPASGLIGSWNNRAAQLYMLILAANSPRADLVDFTDMVSVDQRIRDAPFPANLSYMCLPLYDSLLGLAARGMRAQVLKTLLAASELFPEYVTILLAQANDPTNVRGEVLARCLQKFTGLPGSRPTYMAVMQTLLKVNKDLLVWLFRASLKRATTSKDVVEILSRMESMGENIVQRVEEEGTSDELVNLWCIKADTSVFNLEVKVRNVLDSQPAFVKPLAVFLRNYGPRLRPKDTHGSIVSFESFSIVLGVLSRHMQGKGSSGSSNSVVSMEELRELSMFAHRYQPELKGVPGNQSRLRPGQMLQGRPDGVNSDLQSGSGSSNLVFDEVEKEANLNFQKIYTKDMSTANAIQLLKRLKTSSDQKDQDIFRCMIHNFFDEYRFFQNYPEQELKLTGVLFGMLIQNQLVSSITLGISLRYVLESIRRDPGGGNVYAKMFQIFGVSALEQFRSRLGEWPQYCSHLLQIPHFGKYCPQLFQDVQSAMNNQPLAPSSVANGHDSNPVMPGKVQDNASLPGITNAMAGFHLDSSIPIPFAEGHTAPIEPATAIEEVVPVVVDVPQAMLTRLEKLSIIDSMVIVNTDPAIDPILPPDNIQDQIFFIINNVANNNYETKSVQLQKLLSSEHHSWFASYLVSKRISTQPNNHALYLSVLDIINSRSLNVALLNSTYFHITNLLQSPNITSSSSERSLLRNLGMWLGQVTLARNKPVLQRRLNLKELLFWGFETGRLIAVCSFVAKIVEGIRESTVFRPPNPWLMPLLGVLRDLYETDDLKMNIKFEVQVLCKSVNIRIDDIPKANMLVHCRVPVKDGRNPDFNIKSAPAAVQKLSPPLPSPQPESKSDIPSVTEQPVIPNLASYVIINPSLHILTADPSRRRLVVLAVDKAIRDVIQPVVERSAFIACMTAKQVVLKDFASEPNENQLRTAAHAMVSSVAGNLAAATSKESLRAGIGKNLRASISTITSDPTVIDQVVLTCSNENVDLGCALVKKAAMEKAIRDTDEQLSGAYQARRKAREAGMSFVDSVFRDDVANKHLDMLPDALKIMQGASASQLTLYEEFRRQRSVTAAAGPGGVGGETTSEPGTTPAQAQVQQPNGAGLSMQQAMEAYRVVLTRLDAALSKLNSQLQGREVTMSMLGGDHEILALLRDTIVVTQRTMPTVRIEAAFVFAENIFKRLMESPDVANSLRLDVFVGVLDGLRDACGGPKKFVPDISSWLSRHASFLNDEMSRKVNRAVLIRLLRVKFLRSQEVDIYFASFMDGGRNMVWVEQALNFVRQCLADGLAATYEFTSIFDTVSKMRPANAAVRKQLQKWLTDLRSLAALKDEQGNASKPVADQGSPPAQQGMQGQISNGNAVAPGSASPISDSSLPPTARNDTPVREHVTVLLERWLRVWSSTSDQTFGQYLQLMHQYGVLKTEASADKFFRVATELCVEACLKSGQVSASAQNGSTPGAQLVFTVIDALAKLFMLLVRLADKEAGAVQLLTRILNAVVRTLIDDHDGRKTSKTVFDQRPYFRLLLNLSQDIGIPDPQKELRPKVLAILSTYSHMYSLLVPQQVPGFAFAWLQLITHRCFMPHLLLVKNQKGWPHMHRLLLALLVFLKPYLKSAQMNEAIRKLYTGMLRVLLVLLHDFPEFLSDYHISFCDAIPETCVQLRNLILSAFSRSMRLPDPLTQSLKLDSVAEIKLPPRILTDYASALGNIRQRLDGYLTTMHPADFPSLLPSVLVSGREYNVTLISVLTLYVGAKGSEMQSQPGQSTPHMEIFKHLVFVLPPQGRYHLLNAMANQLRYPNSHTHYFSQLLLTLFIEAENVYVQEQITRVLLERLIVSKPHPWGLLVTFIELIKNPVYAFWSRPFTNCAPEIEKVFGDVARSCKIVGPGGASPSMTVKMPGVGGN